MGVRELLAVAPGGEASFYEAALGVAGVREVVLLNTCNRVEVYVAGRGVDAVALAGLLARDGGLPVDGVLAHCRWLEGRAAVGHLFGVAAGVDSQMVGEGEILGQVREAYAGALARGATGAVCNRVFQKSFQAAAWARASTGIGAGQVSVGNVAVELAGRIFGELGDCSVLVLGTGDVGRKTAHAFVSRGARAVTVASRTFANARALAAEVGGAAVELAVALESLGRHDVVIGSAAVAAPLVGLDAVRGTVRARARGALFLIDLGLPRNFAAEARWVPGVYLYNLDDLSAIANENLRARLAEVARAKAGLAARADRVWGVLLRGMR
ncbi:MAG: glutamyl-tRNA reductase [Puniceicoccales bacterium]|nr:glutamyl-tRNA reductase [Puniceicoccales bacterium]